jgi:hypothetical protein
VENVAVTDNFFFLGPGNVPSTISFDITYTKSGMPRTIVPASHDPLSAFHWAGKMWKATNSGTFSVAYNDGSFSATGSFSSSGLFGEMGTEKNGIFVGEEDQGENESAHEAAEPTESVRSPESVILPAPLRARMR